MKVAIATTLINAEKVIDSFIQYHLHIGFDHIFLCFDNPNDATVPLAKKYPDVTTFLCDDRWQQRWQNTETIKNKKFGAGQYIHRETMTRQMLNFEVVMHEAKMQGYDWLLHIDADELFYSPYITVKDHFTFLSKKGTATAIYSNHEAICETDEVEDYFKEVTLFKKNQSVLTRKQANLLKGIKEQLTFGYFHFYNNGKSSVNLHSSYKPDGVHRFASAKENPLARFKRNMAGQYYLMKLWLRIVDKKWPCILHYSCCGIEHFTNKYKTLGIFGDKWFGKVPIAQALPLHVAARDTIALNDPAMALDFFRKYLNWKDTKELNELMKHEICVRIQAPAHWLKSQTKEVEATT